MLKLLNIEKYVIAALIAALAYVTYQFVTLDDDLKLANQTIEAKTAAIEALSLQAEYLTQSVKLSEEQNTKLMRERESLSRINQNYQVQVGELANNLSQAQSNIEKLRESSNEAVNQWANDSVPCDAIRLLKYARAASCDQNGSANTIPVLNTTGRISIQL
ncbi:hypothetical protein FQP85_21970 [Pseudoalteromonas neustonica]|uniref:Lysis protein n=1 Tax=Pseudoalteromonas neustonica TaxID=1840331 RepID=A0ABY3F7C8_9GAMM|nr:hypothetical protein [Pseudoalteromonas neustonica]TVU79862.1 hypothetical protein FQP85_21970 [Pseudoalteromonas neustonica]